MRVTLTRPPRRTRTAHAPGRTHTHTQQHSYSSKRHTHALSHTDPPTDRSESFRETGRCGVQFRGQNGEWRAARVSVCARWRRRCPLLPCPRVRACVTHRLGARRGLCVACRHAYLCGSCRTSRWRGRVCALPGVCMAPFSPLPVVFLSCICVGGVGEADRGARDPANLAIAPASSRLLHPICFRGGVRQSPAPPVPAATPTPFAVRCCAALWGGRVCVRAGGVCARRVAKFRPATVCPDALAVCSRSPPACVPPFARSYVCFLRVLGTVCVRPPFSCLRASVRV